MKRLDQIIIRTSFKTTHPCIHSGLRRDNEDGCFAPGRPQLSNKGETVAVGKTKIDNEEIIAHHCYGATESSRGPDGINQVFVSAQTIGNDNLQARVVLQEQHTHDRSPIFSSTAY